jgi:hypothetical protein
MTRFIMERYEEPDSDGHRFFAERMESDIGEPDFDALTDAAQAWCEENFGPHPGPGEDLEGTRWCGETMYWFRDERDAMIFKLRWC